MAILNQQHAQAIEFFRVKRFSEAMEILQGLQAQNPYEAFYHLNISECALGMGDAHTALKAARRCLSLDPYSHRGLFQIGAAYQAHGLWEEAKDAYDKALSIAGEMPTAHWNRGHCNLALGNWSEGWRDYQYGTSGKMRTLRLPFKQWDGKSNPDGVLLVCGEQGLGDQIQFLRFLRAARERWQGTIILEVASELVGLAEPFADLVYCSTGDGSVPHAYDAWVSMLDLPYHLGIEAPDPSAYLVPPTCDLDLDSAKVGFCWCGNPKNPNDHNRSLTSDEAKQFEQFAPILGCLQPVGEPPFEMPQVWGLDMQVTLAAVSRLDLVVTVDTAVAHLAGAAGKECWLIPPVNGEYRWGAEGDSTPWYESIKVFRCPDGERQPPLDLVKEGLRKRYPDIKAEAA